MQRKIFLEENFESLTLEIDTQTDLCNILANIKPNQKRLLISKLDYTQARHIFAQGCIELQKLKKGL